MRGTEDPRNRKARNRKARNLERGALGEEGAKREGVAGLKHLAVGVVCREAFNWKPGVTYPRYALLFNHTRRRSMSGKNILSLVVAIVVGIIVVKVIFAILGFVVG